MSCTFAASSPFSANTSSAARSREIFTVGSAARDISDLWVIISRASPAASEGRQIQGALHVRTVFVLAFFGRFFGPRPFRMRSLVGTHDDPRQGIHGWAYGPA